MSIFVATSRSFTGYFFAQSILSPIKRCILSLIAASILVFAGNAHAVITVGLSIENDLDSNGKITVINGGKVKVAYTVIQDDDKDLHKKDKIQLLRVSDDTVVASVDRGKKKTGTVSLKVKNSVGEQLYVRYVRKSGSQIATAPNQVTTIAKASLADLTTRLNAVEMNGITAPLFSGDGSAGDLTVSSNTNWASTPPLNTNFRNITINAGRTLTVPAGTTITCSGSFVNNGTLSVNAGATAEGTGWIANNPQSSGPRGSAHPGDAHSEATLGQFDNDSISDPVILRGGEGGNGIPESSARLSFTNFRFGGGAGASADSVPPGGGGLVKIYCRGIITNLGTINANGVNGDSDGGGGGGGIVILASLDTVDNSGTLNAFGGNGGADGGNFGASGGGGGGIVILMSPTPPTLGSVNVTGGSGATGNNTQSNKGRLAGSGGGGSGGDGGEGGGVSNTGANGSANPGSPGYAITITGDPLYLPR